MLWSYKLFYGTSGTGCGTNTTYGFPGTSIYGYGNNISSAVARSGCRGQHYDGTYYGGASIMCDCYGMGAMNDARSSIVFRP